MTTLKTKRLILRQWREEDLEPFAQINAAERQLAIHSVFSLISNLYLSHLPIRPTNLNYIKTNRSRDNKMRSLKIEEEINGKGNELR